MREMKEMVPRHFVNLMSCQPTKKSDSMKGKEQSWLISWELTQFNLRLGPRLSYPRCEALIGS